MLPASLPAALQRFIVTVDALLTTESDEHKLQPQVANAMQKLVSKDDWLDTSLARPHVDYYQQYLLYADPDERFSVVSFVWGPGQQTPIHNHTVWGVIGMLRGQEISQDYRIGSDGVPIPQGQAVRLDPGDIALVSPALGDIHGVSNALTDDVSISIHAYGGNIGKIQRHVYPQQGGQAKNFISGYSNVEH